MNAGVDREAYFDVTFLAFGGDLRGIPQVIFQLVRLLRKDPAFARMRYVSTPAVTRDWLEPWGVPADRIDHVRPLPLLGRYERFHGCFATFRYRAILRRAALVIHPELRTVLRTRVPRMVFYYDFIIFDPAATGEPRKWIRWLCYLYKNRLAAKAGFKVSISEATRRRALELFPSIRPESVTPLLLGIRMPVADGPRPAPVQGDKLKFLYVGSYEARKNIPALLDNLAVICGGRPAVLQLAGRMKPAQEADLRSRVPALSRGIEVVFRGLVEEGELRDLYRGTDFLLFPSLSEGFGLPVAEAMAQGAVVCAFRNSSLPEIGGDAAVLAADGDFAAWGSAIGSLASDPEAYRQASLRGLRRAEGLTEAQMHARYGAYLRGAMAACGAGAGA